MFILDKLLLFLWLDMTNSFSYCLDTDLNVYELSVDTLVLLDPMLYLFLSNSSNLLDLFDAFILTFSESRFLFLFTFLSGFF
jgi:hypothetical protein